ncbi:MAG: PKD domain-containing protein [bacterium]
MKKIYLAVIFLFVFFAFIRCPIIFAYEKAGWIDDINLSDSSLYANCLNPKIVSTPTSKYIFWIEKNRNENYVAVLFSEYMQGKKGNTQVAVKNFVGESFRYFGSAFDVFAGQDGKIHFVYVGEGELLYYKIFDGKNWSAPEFVDSGGYPSLIVDPEDNPHIIYQKNQDGIFYANKKDNIWNQFKLSGVEGLLTNTTNSKLVAIDEEENIYVVWGDYIKGVLMSRKFHGSQWLEPTVIPKYEEGNISDFGIIAFKGKLVAIYRINYDIFVYMSYDGGNNWENIKTIIACSENLPNTSWCGMQNLHFFADFDEKIYLAWEEHEVYFPGGIFQLSKTGLIYAEINKGQAFFKEYIVKTEDPAPFATYSYPYISRDNNGNIYATWVLNSDVYASMKYVNEENQNFSFVHLTDVHLGSNLTAGADLVGEAWYEELSYPRFADTLYEISKLSYKPDFILISGDNVEYAGGEDGLRFLEDFKSMTENFTKNTGINIYTVPGNHDRYERPVLDDFPYTGGNDELENYHKIMTELPANEILFFNETLNNKTSGEAGYNRYNYYFTHKGVKFIGMDSGEDTGITNPALPLSSGLSDRHILALGLIPADKKIIFMHSPIFNNRLDVFNYAGTIKNNRAEFMEYCQNNNVELVLSGHTHEPLVSNIEGHFIIEPEMENTVLSTTDNPLFTQTQSTTKDKGDYIHGYRIIDVSDGDINLRTSSATKSQPKIIADLCNDYISENCGSDLILKILNPDDNNPITFNNANSDDFKPFVFTAPASKRIFLYKDSNISDVEVDNNEYLNSNFSLILQKRLDDVFEYKFDNINGFNIVNKNDFFGNPLIKTFSSNDGNGIFIEFKNLYRRVCAKYKIHIDWGTVSNSKGLAGFSLICNDFSGDNQLAVFNKFAGKATADLGSPGELRVYNETGEKTGLVDSEIKEDIPYSVYIPEEEKVIIFSDDSENNNYTYEVAGLDNDTYDLEIKTETEGEESIIFKATDMPTNVGVKHNYSIDWQALKNNEKGVTVSIDENGDGEFEKIITADNILSPPVSNAGVGYEAFEGDLINFNGSNSTDLDGEIILYEWDFNGDGLYDESSSSSTILYAYKDDFKGASNLRVMDDEGLTSATSTNVIVSNANPVADIGKDKTIEIFEKVFLETNFTDAGCDDTHTALINWGDGAEENIAIKDNKKIFASHLYGASGIYNVTLVIEDDDGGKGSDEIIIKVNKSARQLKLDSLQELENLILTDKHIKNDIEKAIKDIKQSLSLKLWVDDSRLNPNLGQQVFNEEKQAFNDLIRVLKEQKGKKNIGNISDKIQNIVNDLAQSDILLAKAAIYDAKNIKINDKFFQKKANVEINKAEKELEMAILVFNNNNLDKMIDYLRDSWHHAQLAIDFLNKTIKIN